MMQSKVVAVLSSHTPSLFWFRMDMMKAFAARGWQVYAIGNEPEEAWASRFSQEGITYKAINVSRNGMNPLGDVATFMSIRRLLKELKPGKIFCYQAKTVIYGSLAARTLGIRDVYPLIAGMGSVFLRDGLKTKLVRGILTTEYRLALKKCPAVFFQNGDDVAIFRKYGIIKGQNIVMLHGSGVSTTKFQAAPYPAEPAFLCISRLIRDKGVMEYLQAARLLKDKYPHVRCVLVGPYDTNPSAITPQELQPYIDDGIVEYMGEAQDVRPYLYDASVFVLASYREGTPKTCLEAMASGRPVITTDAPGCRETVTDGQNGFLVPVKDVQALFGKMAWFVEHPQEISRMGQAGRKLAEDVFDVDKVDAVICQTMGI